MAAMTTTISSTTPDNTLLLTGFEPFGAFTVNPTEAIVRTLDGEVIAGCRVKGLVLPVVFGAAGDLLLQALEATSPKAVICLGLAGKRTDIAIERIAVNLDDADIPDNAGNRPVDQPVVPGGPPAYWSTLPVKAMLEALKENTIPASISLSAGTFVCNHVFYRLMQALEGRPGTQGGFVHVPPISGQSPANGRAELEALADSIRKILVTAASRLAS